MKVKIYAEGDETPEQAEEALFKALSAQRNGDAHLNESFDDPAMVDLSRRLAEEHKKIYQDLVQEINDAIDEEYNDGY